MGFRDDGRVFHGSRSKRQSALSFRVFGVGLAVLVMVAALAFIIQAWTSRNQVSLPESQATSISAPVEPRFTDGCGHPYYPLYADGETVFGRIKGSDVVEEMSLVTIARTGDEYLQRLEINGAGYSLPVTCRSGRVETGAYIDWAGVFGEPLRVMEAQKVNGLRIPVNFGAGDRWLTEFMFDAGGLPANHAYGADSVVVTLDNQSFVPETLSVPGGQMQVLRVLVRQRIQYLNPDGTEAHPVRERDYYEYWAQGKGLVRVHAEKVNEWDYAMIAQGVHLSN